MSFAGGVQVLEESALLGTSPGYLFSGSTVTIKTTFAATGFQQVRLISFTINITSRLLEL